MFRAPGSSSAVTGADCAAMPADAQGRKRAIVPDVLAAFLIVVGAQALFAGIAAIVLSMLFPSGFDLFYSYMYPMYDVAGAADHFLPSVVALNAELLLQYGIIFTLTGLFLTKLDVFRFYGRYFRPRFDPASLLDDMGLHVDRQGFLFLAIGILLGLTIVAAYLIISLLTGVINYDGNYIGSIPAITVLFSIVLALASNFAVGVGEETLFRGYIQRTLGKVWGPRLAIGGAAFLFMLWHMTDSSRLLLGYFDTLVMGLVLGYMLYLTGSLWVPIGFHFAWDFMATSVLSSQDSLPLVVFSGSSRFGLAGVALGNGVEVIELLVCLLLLAVIWALARDNMPAAEAETAGEDDVAPSLITTAAAHRPESESVPVADDGGWPQAASPAIAEDPAIQDGPATINAAEPDNAERKDNGDLIKIILLILLVLAFCVLVFSH